MGLVGGRSSTFVLSFHVGDRLVRRGAYHHAVTEVHDDHPTGLPSGPRGRRNGYLAVSGDRHYVLARGHAVYYMQWQYRCMDPGAALSHQRQSDTHRLAIEMITAYLQEE